MVRRIFEEMLTIGSPTQIAANLTAEGSRPRPGRTQKARPAAARASTKVPAQAAAQPHLPGELSHKGNLVPRRASADHRPGALGQGGTPSWPRMPCRSVETKIRSRTDALLRGLLYAPIGERMYPTHSNKRAKYHHYVSKSESRFGAPGKSYERLPAPEIEAAVAQIRTVLTSPESIASVVRHIQRNGAQIDEATTVMAMGRLNDVWDQLFRSSATASPT